MDIIKEYLVSLGFKTNQSQFNEVKQSINTADKMVRNFFNTSTTQFNQVQNVMSQAREVANNFSNISTEHFNTAQNTIVEVEKTIGRVSVSYLRAFIIAESIVVSFVQTTSIALAKFMDNLAQTQIRNEMFARQMYTTVDNATAVTNSLHAMGRSLEELYLSPELIKQFQQLRNEAFQLRPPIEYNAYMKQIRSVTFEFARLKLELTYLGQWVGYYLYKYLEPFISKFKAGMQSLNDNLTKNMPHWANEIAKVLAVVGRLGFALLTYYETLIKIFNAIPTQIKVLGGVFAGFFTLLKMGPIGWMIAGLTSLLLLIDDYTTYESGGKSAFAGLWEQFDSLKQGLKDNGMMDSFKKDFKDLGDNVGNVVDNLKELIKQLGILSESLGILELIKGVFQILFKLFNCILVVITDVVKSLGFFIKTISDLLKGDFVGALKDFTKGSKSLFEPFDDVIHAMADNMPLQRRQKNNQQSNLNSKVFEWGSIAGSHPYAYPQITPQAFRQNVEQNNTYHIYGSSDPSATATAVTRVSSINLGNFRPIFL
jgi:mRNA-degrading endonuclease YafQ of YafQ-DinJ toxin-antitoxin module